MLLVDCFGEVRERGGRQHTYVVLGVLLHKLVNRAGHFLGRLQRVRLGPLPRESAVTSRALHFPPTDPLSGVSFPEVGPRSAVRGVGWTESLLSPPTGILSAVFYFTGGL